MRTLLAMGVFLAAGGVVDAGAATDGEGDSSVPYPHPVITEVMFHVPKAEGDEQYDANGDGSRDARTDEFIELYNPHSEPIDLTGYTIVSRLAWHDLKGRDRGNAGVRFRFPEFTLPPGYVALIFNAEARTLGPGVGSESEAPEKTHAEFSDAFVFGVSTSSQNRALRNSGDFVLVLEPDNSPVDCVWWGDPEIEPPPAQRVVSGGDDVEETVRTLYRLVEVDASPGGSVARSPWRDSMIAHTDLDEDARPFSPGEIVLPRPDDSEAND